jgi:MFS family permease
MTAPSGTTASTVPTSLYHGWRVVAAAFAIALFGWGLGFYGPGIYLVALASGHGWPAADLATAITGYYIAGAALVLGTGRAFQHCGARAVVIAGMTAMAGGLVLLTWASQLWQVYVAFLVMAPGWAALSGAAINIIIAPWFERRRGLALSLALNGASAGGIIIAPLLIFLIGSLGFEAAVATVAGLMLAVLLPTVTFILRPPRPRERDHADAERTPSGSSRGAKWPLHVVLRSMRFHTIAIPFALGLTAQVAVLTHQVAYLAPQLGLSAAGWTVSLTTAAAVIGRIVTGLFIDRTNRRMAGCANLLLQIAGTALLAWQPGIAAIYAGSILFGLAAGTMITLPGLIVAQEFPAAQFSRIVSLVAAINQFTFAFGPGLLGAIAAEGGYPMALVVCIGMQTVAAIIVVLPVFRATTRS